MPAKEIRYSADVRERMLCAVAVTKVGGATEITVKERKDHVEHVMHATRAAIEECIVAGGGAALLYATRALGVVVPEDDNQRVGIDIVRNALTTPCRLIAENAGIDGDVVVAKLLESNDTEWVLDAQSGTYCNLIEAGIIDPTKVVRTTLQDAASAGGLLITTEAMVAEMPKNKVPAGDKAGIGH